eukprot:11221251-Alexandrium_andersonii.AAC.1
MALQLVERERRRLERLEAAIEAVGADRVGEVWGLRAQTALDLEDQCREFGVPAGTGPARHAA